MDLEQEAVESFAALSLRRRLLLHEFNNDLRNTLASFLVKWMKLNDSVEEIGIEILEDFDEDGNGWSGIEIHLHTEDEDNHLDLQDNFLEFLRTNILDPNFEMIASAISEPLWVKRVEEIEEAGEDLV